MVDFLPIVKKIKDPDDTLDADAENSWTKVPRDWQKLLLGQKAATDPQTQALVAQATANAAAAGHNVTPIDNTPVIQAPVVHVPTIKELESAKEMFVYNIPDTSKE